LTRGCPFPGSGILEAVRGAIMQINEEFQVIKFRKIISLVPERVHH